MKGKYAAKAATRAASLDNEVIAEMRAKVKVAEAERDSVVRELAAVRRDFNGRVIREVSQGIQAERASLAEALAAERAAMSQAMRAAADEMTDLLGEMFASLHEKFGQDVDTPFFPKAVITRLSGEDGPSLLRVLKTLDAEHAGELADRVLTGNGAIPFLGSDFPGAARQRRRRSANDIDRDMAVNDAAKKNQRLAKKIAAKLTADDHQEA
jgi:hypothetical protein